MTKNQPFFTHDRDSDTFMPTPVSNGPWDPNSLHGRVVVGLLAHAIEQRHGSDDFVPARLTVDMFRLPNTTTAIEVKTGLVRDGKRIKVVEAEFFSGGTSMARASCQLLRKTENAPGNVWSPPNWDAPKPADIPKPTDPRLGMNGKWTTRPIVGHMGALGPRRLWMSEVRELVDGIPMSPFVHVATGADFASPFANAGDQGLGYINSDVTLYLHRLPVTPWVGFEVVNHHATDGIAIGECWLYDEKGPIGTSTVAALAQRKPMTNVPPP
jgi:hypothetical protein